MVWSGYNFMWFLFQECTHYTNYIILSGLYLLYVWNYLFMIILTKFHLDNSKRMMNRCRNSTGVRTVAGMATVSDRSRVAKGQIHSCKPSSVQTNSRKSASVNANVSMNSVVHFLFFLYL